MTFNDLLVELTCCKSDGTEVLVSCGQGLSCANACFAKEASLCPSQNCGDCGNVDQEDAGSEDSGRGNTLQRRQGGFSPLTNLASALNSCWGQRCPVRPRPACCFHRGCRKRRSKQCRWFQFFTGKLMRSISHIIFKTAGTFCPKPGRIVNGNWTCETHQILLPNDNNQTGTMETFPGTANGT